MMGKLRYLRSLPKEERAIFLRIAVLVPLVEGSVRILGFNRTVRVLKRTLVRKQMCDPEPARTIVRHQNYLNAFHLKYPGLGRCLARSLTLWLLLKNRGIETDLKFGIKKEKSELAAHAWIEFEGNRIEVESDENADYASFSESIIR
jgi:Transglutaminase-like superfamily